MLEMVLLDTDKLPKKNYIQMEQRLTPLGNLTSYDTTGIDEVVTRCKNAEIILVNKNIINREHISALPKLKYIIVIATGYDNVDINAAKEYGVKVSNTPTYGSQTVAQHTIALILELTNKVGWLNQMVKEGKWNGLRHKHIELANQTIGIVGCGNIAKCVIKAVLGLGMNVIVCSSKGKDANYDTDLPVKFVDKETLFKNSDVISLHCPVNDATIGLVNKASLGMMKPTSFLVNTSRGLLIDETDLYDALSNKIIAGAALDVLRVEPAESDNPLLKLDNCIFTPHNAWVSEVALGRWLDNIQTCVMKYLNNEFITLV